MTTVNLATPLRPDVSARARVDGLDTLRALAILLVFMYHYMVFVSRVPTFGWASTIGWTGVDLFFVLSGYLIANQLFAGIVRGEKLSPRAFYVRRFLRTLPNYYVVLAAYLLFPALLGGREPPPLWRFVTFTQNIQLQPGTAFSHAWSLCIEEQFYLLLPLVLLAALRWGRSIRGAWIALGLLMLAGIVIRGVLWSQHGREVDGGYYPYIYYSSICRFDEFLPGIAVALLKNFHRETWARMLRCGQSWLLAGVASTAVTAALLLRYYQIEDYGYGFAMTAVGYPMIALSFALLLIAALSPRSWLHRIRVPGAAALAAWSYAIYLSHKPLANVLLGGLTPLGIEANSFAAVLLIGAACTLVGWLLYRLVESPFMRLRDRHWPTNFQRSARSSPSAALGAKA
ncbi:MAG: acyltransferase [Tahibacter sp.]